MASVSLTASADYGLSGQYIARIIGRDSKFTFQREFIGRKYGKRNEGSEADVDESGLYELCDVTKKRGKVQRYRVVLELPSGELAKLVASKEDAMAIAKALDAGRAFGDIVRYCEGVDDAGNDVPAYEILSAKQAEKAQSAATVDSAIATCWAAIEALPAKDAKKVLAALRAKLAPAPAPEPADTAGQADSEVTS